MLLWNCSVVFFDSNVSRNLIFFAALPVNPSTIKLQCWSVCSMMPRRGSAPLVIKTKMNGEEELPGWVRDVKLTKLCTWILRRTGDIQRIERFIDDVLRYRVAFTFSHLTQGSAGWMSRMWTHVEDVCLSFYLFAGIQLWRRRWQTASPHTVNAFIKILCDCNT